MTVDSGTATLTPLAGRRTGSKVGAAHVATEVIDKRAVTGFAVREFTASPAVLRVQSNHFAWFRA